jgi:hypothetical protein
VSGHANRANRGSTPQHTDPWQHFQTLLHNGFRPPTGTGRCRTCGYHTKTQGHRGGCPKTKTKANR